MKKGIFGLGLLYALVATNAFAEDVRFVVQNTYFEVLPEQAQLTSHRNVGSSAVVSVHADYADVYFELLKLNGFHAERSVSFSRDPISSRSSYGIGANMSGASSLPYSDPELSNQGSFYSENNSILAGMLKQKEPGDPVSVLVLDTGYAPHEDVEVHGGYSYTTLYGSRTNPNYEDITIMGSGEECSSGHGTAMAGVIAATQNNGIGMTGISNAKIYMGRVLSTNCSTMRDEGDLVDLYEALIDVSEGRSNRSIPVPDVINVSLAARSVCPDFLQEAIDDLRDKGSIFVVSAGNQADITASHTPANCSGVLVVGAHDNNGGRALYSNYGQQVDVAMGGTHLVPVDGVFYEDQTGTSLSAAAVSGMVAVLKQNFESASSQDLIDTIVKSSKPFPDLGCSQGCGSGMANLDMAMDMAEHVLDPVFTLEHGMSGMDSSCMVSALSNHKDVCSTVLVDIKTRFAELDTPVDYQFKTLRKDKGVSSWSHHSVAQIGDFEHSANHEKIAIQDVDFFRYDYAVAACYEDDCSFITPLAEEDLDYPDYCG